MTSILNWRPRTPFYYGWLILAMAALGTLAATGVSQVVLGGIQGFILEDMEWDRSTIALAALAGTWSSALLSPVVGRLADRYGPRWLMPFGLTVVGICLIGFSLCNSIWQFFIPYIVARGVSNPVLIGIVPRTAAVNFFRRKRNIALSLTGMSRPVTGAINIQIISAFAVAYSWRTAYRYLGALSFFLILPLMVLMRRRPEDIGLLPDGARPREIGEEPSPIDGHSGHRSAIGNRDQEFNWTAKEAFRTRALWFVGICTALGTMGGSSIGFSMVLYLQEEVGISKAQAAGVLSISTFMAISNLGWGYLADRFTPRWCLIVAMVSASASVLYLLTVSSLPMALVFGLVWGIFTGSIGVLEQMILAQYFGRASYGTISGTLSPLQTGALGLGPAMGALVRNATGTYRWLNVIVAGSYLLAALLIFLARPPALPRRASTESPDRAD
ncbi:MAG: MFS transporter [Dehalococcoidia bacterium]|nr:MFS transporter [Dehalococcoidia bacterium]